MDKLQIAKSKFRKAAKYANGSDVYGVNLLAEGLLALTEALENTQRKPRQARAKRK